MGADTKIQWADHTFNPWRGCAKVSPACDHCYAEAMSHRNPATLGEWGAGSRRAIGTESYWLQPRKWNRQAEADGVRRRVFCLSLGDVFEGRDDLVLPRERLWRLIQETPALDWLLLTKRPHIAVSWTQSHGWPTNAWAGITVENQAMASERIPYLLQIPAPVRFLSAEPLLDSFEVPTRGIDWIIIGGESGPKARPFHLSDARELLAQAQQFPKIAVFVKQLGTRAIDKAGARLSLRDPKGGDMAEWPEGLRVRCLPQATWRDDGCP